MNAIIYCTKQRGAYEESGFVEGFIDKCREVSFELPESMFDSELQLLCDKFLTSTQDPYDFSADLCILYSKHNKRVHFRDIQGLVNSKIIKRDPSKALQMVKKFCVY